ncbi:MAG: ATP-binding protein [Longimonas sp.]|uniref:sensor histidine kinase n=1 Tax=Longimonas sp. TaxID=2039626 RepID=UPI003356946B
MLTSAWYVQWLGCKIAGGAALASGGTALLAGVSAGQSLLIAAGTALASYAIVWWSTHGRFQRMHDILHHLRAHQFGTLKAPPSPRGDELDALVWELYRTAQMSDREIDDMRKMESYRREFIGNVSHELKTPIFSIQGFAETLAEGAVDDPDVNRTFLRKIIQNATRLDRLARDLSAIARLEQGEMEMQITRFNVGTLMHEVVETLEPKAQEQDITLRIDGPEEEALPPVQGDRERIRQVLVNLTDNAIKYNEPGGYVALAARASDDVVEVTVRDNGIGIPERHLSRLTERFYRVDKSRARHQGGSGLGLSIVKHILNAHDAHLQVRSKVGEGSTFTFVLPVA